MATEINARSLWTEGVLIAAVSAFGYLVTFAYEYGFCNHFGIPASLIEPNVSTFLVATTALGVALLPALNFLAFIVPLFKAAQDPGRRAFRHLYAFLAVLLTAGILLFVIYGFSLAGFLLYLIFAVILLAVAFVPAVLSNRDLPVSERLQIHADIQDKDPFVATNLFEGWVSQRNMRIGLLVVLAIFIAYMVGDAEARKKRFFLSLKYDQGMVLLRSYGDLMIFTRLDHEAEKFHGFRLMWLSEKKQLDLVPREVGPLKGALP